METITSPSGDTLSVDTGVIEIDTQEAEYKFEPSDEERFAIIAGLLGDAPKLDEVSEDLTHKSDGELEFLVKSAAEILKDRRGEILRKAREEEERLAKEQRARIRQINLLEKAYLRTQTGRRAQSTQASQNIAAAMYEAGARVADPTEEDAEAV